MTVTNPKVLALPPGELTLIDPEWETVMADDKRTEHMIETVRPYLAHRVLQPFLEAYQVVADQLVLAPISTSFSMMTPLSCGTLTCWPARKR